MKDTYWDEIADFGPDYHYEESVDTEILVSLILKRCNSVFECSVGTGIIPAMLRNAGFKGDYLGSDYAEKFIQSAQSHNPDEQFIFVDLFAPIPLPDNSYDCCVVHHGLDYVYPYRLALEELKRVAKKYIFITFWVGFPDNDENNIRFNEEGKWNVNYYSKTEFYKTLEELNLEVEQDIEMLGSDKKYNHILILKVCE